MYKINRVVSLLLVAICLASTVEAKIQSQVIEYQIDGEPFQGYISYDDVFSGKRPGVLVVHEWWGHNEYARKRADMLAKLGYIAFALDMYGKGKLAEHPEDAKKFMQATLKNMEVAEKRFEVAMQMLQKQSTVNSEKIAAIGYCFGGSTVLHMARKGSALAGVVSFHGSLGTKAPAKPGQVKAKILVLNGADDPFVTAEQITALKQEMKTADANLEFVNYTGVQHSFTNPEADQFGKKFNMPLLYNAEADKDSWQRMQLFFKQVFQ